MNATYQVPAGELLTKEELATRLKVTQRTVESLQRSGLPYCRLGTRCNRYSWPAVYGWLFPNGDCTGPASAPITTGSSLPK